MNIPNHHVIESSKKHLILPWIGRIAMAVVLVCLEILFALGSFSFRFEDRRVARIYVESVRNPTDRNRRLWENESSRVRKINNLGQLAMWLGLTANSMVLIFWLKSLDDDK